MIRRIAILVIIFSLCLPASALAADEPGAGIIEGAVVNKTVGGSSVGGLSLTLKTYLNDNEVGSATTKTDAGGRFLFDGLATEPGYSYQVVVNFQQAEYQSDRLSFNDEETSKSADIIVYDSTTSDESIKVAMSHMIIYAGEGTLFVKEYYLYVNEADRTYIGPAAVESRKTLKFSLPEGASELQPTLGLMECCIVSNEEGFSDTMPVLPGSKEVAYSYKVAYSSRTHTLSRTVNYPMASFDLLIQGEGIEATGDQLTKGEPMEIRGNQFSHLFRKDLMPGDTLVIRLSGLSGASNQRTIIWAAITLAVLAAGFGLTYRLIRKRLPPLSPEDNLERRKQRLLAELAGLDDDFEAGKIPEDTYRKLRAAKKAQLVELMR